MSLKLGIENDESGSKFIVEYTNKNYTKNLSNILGTKIFNEPLKASFIISGSSYYFKYALNLKNFFFIQLNEKIWSSNLEISSKKKMIKLVNFDILPVIKFTTTNNEYPLSISLKYANYRGSSEQHFGNYDYSQILKSLLPHNRIGIGIKYEDSIDFNENISGKNLKENLLLYRFKIKSNKIFNYENSLKFIFSTKYLKDFDILNQCSLGLSNETHFKTSYIFNEKNNIKGNEGSNSDDIISFNPNHLLSANEAISRILGVNVSGLQKEINLGQNFYISNYTHLKLKNFKFLEEYGFLYLIEPFIGFETLFVPTYLKNNKKVTNNYSLSSINLAKSFKLIGCMGISIKVHESMSIDFTLKTSAKNIDNIDTSLINKFRMNMNL